MEQEHYACGYDFGTLSCRITVCDLQNGETVFEASADYPHGVITGQLGNALLPDNWALQNPEDYREVMISLTTMALQKIPAEKIVAIGTDFTNCTVVALSKEGKPLCEMPQFRNCPHAWVKLWKHHAAQSYAERIEAVLREKEIPWFERYGQTVSSEWLFPKLLQIYEEAPELYQATDVFLEAADYIPYWLTGNLTRNSATLGLNAFYVGEFPSPELLDSFSDGFRSVLPKLSGSVKPVGSRAGTLTKAAAIALGLSENVVVSVGHGDSEIVAIGMGMTDPESMLMVMGTSTCYQLNHSTAEPCKGCTITRDGMLPGLYSYESGQPAVGDSFAWFANHMIPAEYYKAAAQQKIPILSYMDQCCCNVNPGESGLMCLDWLNGNRSVLMDFRLSGVIAGLTLETKPEYVYRSLIEGTAFGARRILQEYEQAGIPVEKVFATGGLARKSSVTMQIYADVLNRPLYVTSIPNASTLGAAVCAGVAMEQETGTLEGFRDVCSRMVHYDVKTYTPNPSSVAVYNRLYQIFIEMHDFFGAQSHICATLKEIQSAVKPMNN